MWKYIIFTHGYYLISQTLVQKVTLRSLTLGWGCIWKRHNAQCRSLVLPMSSLSNIVSVCDFKILVNYISSTTGCLGRSGDQNSGSDACPAGAFSLVISPAQWRELESSHLAEQDTECVDISHTREKILPLGDLPRLASLVGTTVIKTPRLAVVINAVQDSKQFRGSQRGYLQNNTWIS